MTVVVEQFTYVSSSGEEVLEKDFLPVWCKSNAGVFDLAAYHWYVEEKKFFARAGGLEEKDIPYFRRSNPTKCTLIDRLLCRPVQHPPKRFVSFHLLPDSSGFLRFESGWDRSDNCLLLDAYGQERMRLTVPWELTGSTNPESAKPPTSFDNVSGPYVNPADGKRGEFGVTAWVACAGKYYFELDYRTGKFLWCVGIRD